MVSDILQILPPLVFLGSLSGILIVVARIRSRMYAHGVSEQYCAHCAQDRTRLQREHAVLVQQQQAQAAEYEKIMIEKERLAADTAALIEKQKVAAPPRRRRSVWERYVAESEYLPMLSRSILNSVQGVLTTEEKTQLTRRQISGLLESMEMRISEVLSAAEFRQLLESSARAGGVNMSADLVEKLARHTEKMAPFLRSQPVAVSYQTERKPLLADSLANDRAS